MGSASRFELTPEQQAMIEAKIVESIDGDPIITARQICADAHVLPLLFDFTAIMAIRPDGELIWLDDADLSRTRPVDDERERNIGLFQGSRRYPDLGFLVPPRPVEAIDCHDCRGTGRIPVPKGSEHLADRIVCYCGGNGWLPAQSGLRQTRPKTGWRKLIRFFLIAVAIPTILFALSLVGLFPWSGLNCRRSEIDINSGRIRQVRFVFWVPFTGPVNDSLLTKALSAEDLVGHSEDWNSVNTLSPGQHHSPHHNFHGAFFQIHILESCWESGKMTPAARRETARTVLSLWQDRRGYFGTGNYIETISSRVFEAEKRGKVMDVDDLPKSDDKTPCE